MCHHNNTHAISLSRDGELFEMKVQFFVSFLQENIMDHIQLAADC